MELRRYICNKFTLLCLSHKMLRGNLFPDEEFCYHLRSDLFLDKKFSRHHLHEINVSDDD